MIISKDSNVAKILKENLVTSNTPKSCIEVSSVCFDEGRGIIIKYNDYLNEYRCRCEDVDFTASVSGLIIPVIIAELSNGDAKIEKKNNVVVVNDVYNFKCSECSIPCYEELGHPVLTFSKEQYEKLEKDFIYTTENYFSNPKNVDCIGIAFKEGTVFEVCPGSTLYKISKFDATVNEVEAERLCSHDTRIYLFPRKLFNITKHFDGNINFYFRDDEIIISSDSITYTRYLPPSFGVGKFKEVVNNCLEFTGNENTFKFGALKSVIKDYISPIIRENYKNLEDNEATLTIDNGNITVDINDCFTFEAKVDGIQNVRICCDASVLSFLAEEIPDEADVGFISDSFIGISADKDFYEFSNVEA